jgi:predicted transcriptional regulator
MGKKILKIGIISREDYKKRTIAIARGEYKPRKDEPKVWFESVQSMAQVLSSENQKLLSTMSRYGIVDLVKQKNRAVKPILRATDFKVEFGLNIATRQEGR